MTVVEWLFDYSPFILIGAFLLGKVLEVWCGIRWPRREYPRSPAEDAERELFLRSYQYKTPAPPEFHDNYRKPR